MWIIFGNRVKTERVPNGQRVERRCDHCGETAMFYERRAVSTFQLYFFDVFEYGARRVMACGACGTLYTTDELGDAAARAEALGDGLRADALVDSLQKAAQSAGAAITAGASRARDEFEALRRELSGSGGRASESAPATARDDDESGASDDPLADEDAALLARFEALERKARKPDDPR